MKIWISTSAGELLDFNDDLEGLDLEDIDASPIPEFHFGRTEQNSRVFFNYNYLLRGTPLRDRGSSGDDNLLRFALFDSNDLQKNRGAAPIGYFDLLVDDRHNMKDVLAIHRAWVEPSFLDKGVREEVITSLLKTLKHSLVIHVVDENVMRVLQNLNATNTETGGPVKLGSPAAVPYDVETLTDVAQMSKSEPRRIWKPVRQKLEIYS